MGLVTEYLRDLIARQVNEHGLVVWYDPEENYGDVVPQLDLPDTHFVTYTDSFYRLRHDIEPYFNQLDPPRLIVYVPLDPSDTHHALVEIEVAGVVLKPGQQPVARNTRLSVIARSALKNTLNAETLENVVKGIDAGRLTILDLDNLGEQGEGIARETLALVFPGKPDEEIALLFVSSDQYDTPIIEKDAVGQLRDLLAETYAFPEDKTSTPADLRAAFVRHLLRLDLLLHWRGERPRELSALSVPDEPHVREAVLSLTIMWRNRSDLRSSYVEGAGAVENELRLRHLSMPLDSIREVETFLGTERALQQGVTSALLAESSADWVDLAEAHQQTSFWSQVEDVQPHWALIASSGRLLLEAQRIETALKNAPQDVSTFIQDYTGSESPYCLLDSIHRQMEIRYHKFQFDPDSSSHDLLEQLVIRARNRYMQVGAWMADWFVRAYQQGGFASRHVTKQVDIFEQKVKPALNTGKTAYILVDALRFEMARDLIRGLQDDFEIALESALATPPTITSVGMAALLPGMENAQVVIQNGAVTLQVGDLRLKDRSDRVKYLRMLYPKLLDMKLSDLVPKPKRAQEKDLRAADFALITSQEIDESGESDQEAARLQMDNVLLQLQQALRILARCGFQNIVVTADHGHLFVESAGDEMKIAAPGGNTASLHRRAWLGYGGAQNDSYLRAPLSAFGLKTDYELAVPYTFGIFLAQGGALRYFHGGLSPQEVIIPVLTLTSKGKSGAVTIGEVQWQLQLGSEKLGRFFSVQVTGQRNKLFISDPLVRIELRFNNQPISSTVSAGYGYDSSTEDVQLRFSDESPAEIDPNTVTLMVKTDPSSDALGELLLLDAVAGTVLAKLDKLEFAIHM